MNARFLTCKSSNECVNQCGSLDCLPPATCAYVSGKCDCAHVEVIIESVFGPLNGHI